MCVKEYSAHGESRCDPDSTILRHLERVLGQGGVLSGGSAVGHPPPLAQVLLPHLVVVAHAFFEGAHVALAHAPVLMLGHAVLQRFVQLAAARTRDHSIHGVFGFFGVRRRRRRLLCASVMGRR